MLPFLLGLVLGASALWLLYLASRRQNVRLREEKQMLQQEKQIVVEFMHNLVEAIGEGVNRSQLFQRMVHAAILSTNALSACVFNKTPDGKLKGVAVEGLFPPQKELSLQSTEKLATRAKFIEQVLKSEVYEMGEGIIGSVAKSGKPELIKDARQDPRVVQHKDPSLQVRSLIVAPITFRNQLIGVLAVANPSDGLAFSETDFSLVESIAEQAGMAIHNADLMKLQIEKNKLDFDIRMASSIQSMILPSVFPEIPGLDIAAHYRPAQKIGGDLYDIFELPGGKLGIAVADVSGKGIPASLLMAISQTNLRRFSREYDCPAEVLKAINREVGTGIRQDMFVTFIYGIIDPKANTLTLSRAGHELPLWLHHNDKGEVLVDSIGSEGMAIGMVPPEVFDAVIEVKTVPFKPQDIFLLFTDAITEATNSEGLEFSDLRLRETVKTLRERCAVDLTQGIVSSVERFSGNDVFADDLTLVAVKRL